MATNVVFSALLWRGKPYQLLDAISQHPDRSLFSSPALLDELADVLARPMATRRLALIWYKRQYGIGSLSEGR
ncbi:MAG: hypothetical protein IPM75_14495 [Candidatus Competibacteraceae bacterium]|nr:hypothetical protein [Candidatus Competibacteraceae bacterium]